MAKRVAILGTGNVGGTLGRRWVEAGQAVVFGTRDPQGEKCEVLRAELGSAAEFMSVPEAVAAAEVVVLAAPWSAAQGLLESCASWDNKILVDCTNPLNATFSGLDLGFETSAAEQIATWAPGARVVKAFNTASAATMGDPRYGDQAATMFYCGDDPAAKARVAELISAVGFEPVDAGPLRNARYLEPFAMLYIHLAVREGWGANCAFKIMKR